MWCGEWEEDSSQITIVSVAYQELSPHPSTQIDTGPQAVRYQGARKEEKRSVGYKCARTVDCLVGPIHRDKTDEYAAGQGEVGNWSLEAISQHGVVPPRVLATEGEARHGG